ncbi:hypothetical protein COOONC_02918 [Cooperia oncophora]
MFVFAPPLDQLNANISSLISQNVRMFSELCDPLSKLEYKSICSELDHCDKAKLQPCISYTAYEETTHNREQDTLDYKSWVYPRPEFAIHPEEVLRTLKSLKNSSSATFDGIPQIVYKKCGLVSCGPLSMIPNISLLFGEVPLLWEKAIVTAISKTKYASMLSKFRPISILPTPLKVMEKLIRDNLEKWFSEHHIVPAEQHGFITQLADCVSIGTLQLMMEILSKWSTLSSRKLLIKSIMKCFLSKLYFGYQ